MMKDDLKQRKMSRAFMRQAQNKVILNECLHAQNYYIELDIKDPDGGLVCEVSMSYDQFVRLLICQSEVVVTLTKYRGSDGELHKEEVPEPESVRDGLLADFGDSKESLSNRMVDLRRDIYEMVNKKGAPGKKALEKLLQDAEVIEGHFDSNLPFFTEVAVEKIAEIQENAKSQLSIFAQNLLKVDLQPEDFTPMLESNNILPLPDHTTEPIVEHCELKKRERKPIEEMTAMEVGDALSSRLRQFEKAENKYFDSCQGYVDELAERKQLYMPSASGDQNKVSICYISYQGSGKVELELAKNYLEFLLSINKISEFKCHYNLEKE